MTEETDKETESGTDDLSMSFWGHLEALRWVILRVVIALFICMVGCFIAMPYLFDHFVLAPTSSNFFLYKWLAGIHGDGIWIPDFSSDSYHVELINIRVASQFMTHITTSFWFAIILVFPFLIYQLWTFIRPALYSNERHNVSIAFAGGTFMFYLGCAVGYCIVFPFTFRFLSQYQISETIANQISLDSYMSTFLMLILVMGVVFELPLLAWLLGHLGIINKTFLKQYRRHAVVALLILAAIITPTSDPFTLMMVFLPLYLLYELGICIVKDAEPE